MDSTVAGKSDHSEIWQDFRILTVSFVILSAIVAPQIAYRYGALMCALSVALSLIEGWRLRAADWWALAYVGLTASSLLWTSAFDSGLTSFLNACACVAIFLGVRSAVNRQRDFKAAAFALILGAVLTLGLMIVGSGAHVRWTYDVGAPRVGVEGINMNYSAYSFATVAAIVLILSVRQGMTLERALPRLVSLILVAVMYVGIILTGARGALLSILMLAVWWTFSRFHERAAFWGLIFFVVIINVLMLVGLFDNVIANSISPMSRDTGDLNGRLTIWPIARSVFWESPFFGIGVGGFQEHVRNPYGIGAHSAVLDVGASLGVVGVILFFGTFWLSVNPVLRRSAASRAHFVAGSLIVASLPILLSGFWTESPVLWAAFALISRWGISSQRTRTWRTADTRRAKAALHN